MESLDSYLVRKQRELRLVEACLAQPVANGQARSVEEAVEQKFQAGAAAKAEHARSNWALTETHWADAASFKVGQFEVGYTYQRADLAIQGPPLYEALDRDGGQRILWSGYTSSGMSALATVLLALGRGPGGAVLTVRPDSYPETRQLIETYGQRIGIVASLAASPARTVGESAAQASRVLLLDSGVPAHFPAPDPATAAGADLLMLDTTCLATSSGRIAQMLRYAADAGLPSVLVRSHTKLDSLGIEYGRLGSVVIVVPQRMRPEGQQLAEQLVRETQDAVRLFGAAAVPAHLPPFIGGAPWRSLYRQRVAHIIRNNRRAARRFSVLVPRRCTVTCYQHGLFLTLDPGTSWDQEEAGRMAESLVRSLRDAGLPVRHAGSFGFDFAVVDAFPAIGNDRYILRLAIADLPGAVVDDVVTGTAAWTISPSVSA
jgi:hypothetical protein